MLHESKIKLSKTCAGLQIAIAGIEYEQDIRAVIADNDHGGGALKTVYCISLLQSFS